VGGYMMHRHNDFGMAEKRYLGDSMITGFGTVNGRRVAIFVQDFTLTGAASRSCGSKSCQNSRPGVEAGVPPLLE
jgi:acetyl-CoA carboxylase carboxyltransferase component